MSINNNYSSKRIEHSEKNFLFRECRPCFAALAWRSKSPKVDPSLSNGPALWPQLLGEQLAAQWTALPAGSIRVGCCAARPASPPRASSSNLYEPSASRLRGSRRRRSTPHRARRALLLPRGPVLDGPVSFEPALPASGRGAPALAAGVGLAVAALAFLAALARAAVASRSIATAGERCGCCNGSSFPFPFHRHRPSPSPPPPPRCRLPPTLPLRPHHTTLAPPTALPCAPDIYDPPAPRPHVHASRTTSSRSDRHR